MTEKIAEITKIDFVARKDNNVMYFQVAYILADEATIESEYNAFNPINDHYGKFVVSLDDITQPINKGIRHIQAWKMNELL